MMEAEPSNVLELAAALRIPLYVWQKEILVTIEKAATKTRRKLAVRAPNGVGKTQRIIALSAIRWLQRFPKGKVVITSYDARQVADQLWPAVLAQKEHFPGWEFHNADGRQTITTPSGGRLRAYTTSDPGRAEGFHSDVGAPLLIIVDEAKSIEADIIKAIDRCSYNVLLYISSPGWMEGPFYEAFSKPGFITFHAGLADCPHISQEKIRDIETTYEGDQSYIDSVLRGEFMKHPDGVQHVLELVDADGNQQAYIDKIHGVRVAGVDVAAGRAQNVICLRNGNHAERIHAWREKDTNAAVGRFVRFFNDLSLKPGDIWLDVDGLGIGFYNDFAAVKWAVCQYRGGGKSPHPRYADLNSYCWHTTADKIRKHQIILPDNPVLKRQLTSRRVRYKPDGRLWLESKEDMAGRGVESPDQADAFVIAFGVQPAQSFNYTEQESRFAEIAKAHHWQYESDDEPRTPGGYKDSGMASGFGGVNSEW
jgi:hypothetical protein